MVLVLLAAAMSGCGRDGSCPGFAESEARRAIESAGAAGGDSTCLEGRLAKVRATLREACEASGPLPEAVARAGPGVAVALEVCHPNASANKTVTGSATGSHSTTGRLPPMQRSIMPVPGRVFLPAEKTEPQPPDPQPSN